MSASVASRPDVSQFATVRFLGLSEDAGNMKAAIRRTVEMATNGLKTQYSCFC
jgi:hypothetical protein